MDKDLGPAAQTEVQWLAPRTPEEAADNVEAAHEDHDSEGGCSCVYRMRAALTGQPDPDGVSYAWPIMRYGCEEAQKYGCLTPWEAITEAVMAKMYSAYAANLEINMITGLSATLDATRVYSVPVVIRGAEGQ